MDPQFLPQLEEATLVLDEFVHQCVANRRGQPPVAGAGPIGFTSQGQDEGGLSDRELADILIFLFVAGYATSKNISDDHDVAFGRSARDVRALRRRHRITAARW
jgi:cytochrome P450